MEAPTPEEWARIKALFDAALEQPRDERESFLRESTDDARIVERVLKMLRGDEQAGGFLNSGELGQMAASFISDDAPLAPGDRIDGFEIIEELGRGGMGYVYRAHQEHPERDVAIKVIRPAIATPRMLRRFESESGLLARLNHPGIAHVYGSGVVVVRGEPRPYFAMELVDGEPITKYCARVQPDVASRLRLMATACDAMHHAHQRGVIHRDLKPGNVLVDREGRPRIIDFGIAIDIETDVATLMTSREELLGTLAYMAPERLESDAGMHDTRVDIYALGVIAYEVLGGRSLLPPESMSIPALLHRLEHEPVKPLGQIDRRLRGDVETVIRTAMARDPAWRYAAASDFASDLRCSIAHRPIQARRPSLRYRGRMFARRNPLFVSALLVASLFLISGVVGIVLQWRQTRFQVDMRDRAFRLLIQEPVGNGVVTPEEEHDELRHLAKWLLEESTTDPVQTIWLCNRVANRLTIHGDHDTSVLVLRHTWSLCADGEHVNAMMMLRFGEMYASAVRSGGDPQGALEVLATVLDAVEQVEQRDDLDPGSRASLIRKGKLELIRARSWHDLGRLDEAESLLCRLVTDFEMLEAESPPDQQWDVLASRKALAMVLIDQGPGCTGEALALLDGMRAIHVDRMPPDAVTTSAEIADLDHRAGLAWLARGDADEAEVHLRRALLVLEPRTAPDHPVILALQNALGRARLERGMVDEALLWLELAAGGGDVRLHNHWRRWVYHADLGRCLRILGRDAEAQRELEIARAGLGVFGEGHPLFERVEEMLSEAE